MTKPVNLAALTEYHGLFFYVLFFSDDGFYDTYYYDCAYGPVRDGESRVWIRDAKRPLSDVELPYGK